LTGFSLKILRKSTQQRTCVLSALYDHSVCSGLLEHRQIWGIWGGKDEVDIRRTLSVSYNGEETRRRRFPNCPYCTARPSKLVTSIEELPNGGRWTTAKVVTCTECNFSWRSRTSANAVEAYKLEKEEKSKKSSKKTK
jgi:hypothetical protein